MKDVRLIFEGEGILEKSEADGVFKRIIQAARLVSGPDMESDELIIDSAYYGAIYDVDSEDIVISQDGTIEFEALNAKYRIRKINETDDLNNLNPDDTPEEEE
jgi:hypothetical protein